jgi:isoaspartyl peptidase/L-asparaginase-like protein (Ntn-hydrolase superfamily)
MTNTPYALALHGGAGARPGRDYGREIAHMRSLVLAGGERLAKGEDALTVAVEMVAELEASGLYVAGRGSSPNTLGDYELDACVMAGQTGLAGAVAALQGFESPIKAALAVMQTTPHVLLAGEGARAFAKAAGLAEIADLEAWFTRAGRDESNHAPGEGPSSAAQLAHGTVGCVVRDGQGHLAGATSTGGVFGKRPGRVGDSPIIGAGAWADQTVAVSCTGQGEFFLRTAAAAQIAFRMRFGGQDVETAAKGVLAEIKAMGGEGGLIAIDHAGAITLPFASAGMKRAALYQNGTVVSEAF